jgi:hypothetical protein
MPICGADSGNTAYYTRAVAAGCVVDEDPVNAEENTAAGYSVSVGRVIMHDEDVAVPACVEVFNLADVAAAGGDSQPLWEMATPVLGQTQGVPASTLQSVHGSESAPETAAAHEEPLPSTTIESAEAESASQGESVEYASGGALGSLDRIPRKRLAHQITGLTNLFFEVRHLHKPCCKSHDSPRTWHASAQVQAGRIQDKCPQH